MANRKIINNLLSAGRLYDGKNLNHLVAYNEPSISNVNSTAPRLDTKSDSVISTIENLSDGILAVNPISGNLYVIDFQQGITYVIDGKTDKVIANMSEGYDTTVVSFNPSNGKMYSSSGGNSILVEDGNITKDRIDKIVYGGTENIDLGEVPNPEGIGIGDIAFNPANGKIYVSHGGLDSVYVINGSTNKVISNVSVGDNPTNIAVNPTNGKVYVVNINGLGSVSVIDSNTDKVIETISDVENPRGIEVNPTNGKVYIVNNGERGFVSVIDGNTNKVIARLDIILSQTSPIVFNPAVDKVYVGGPGNVYVIDDKTDQVIDTIRVDDASIFAMAANPVNGKVYVSGDSDEGISIIPISAGSSSITQPDQIPKEDNKTSINGVVYLDENANGVRDENEQGIPNVNITIIDKVGTIKATSSTNGSYYASNIFPGDVKIEVSQPDHYTLTEPQESSYGSLNSYNYYSFDDITTLEPITNIDFGFAAPSGVKVSGAAYLDKNDNGVRDVDENGLSNVNVTINDANSENGTHNIITSANGSYSYLATYSPGHELSVEAQAPEGYFVKEESKVEGGKVFSIDSMESWERVSFSNVTAGQNHTDVNFGFSPLELVTINGTTYLDENADGVRNAGEKGFSNVNVTIHDYDGISDIQTGIDGSYSYQTKIQPYYISLYSIGALSPRGYFETQANDKGFQDSGSRYHFDDLIKPQMNSTNIDFGFAPLSGYGANISGKAFFDKNTNGRLDTGERGLEGINVTLVGVGKEQNMTTSMNGSYSFSNVSPGESGLPYIATISADAPIEFLPIESKANLSNSVHISCCITDFEYHFDNISVSQRLDDINFGFTGSAKLELNIVDEKGNDINITNALVTFTDAVDHKYIDAIVLNNDNNVEVDWIPNHEVQVELDLLKSPYQSITDELTFKLDKAENTGTIKLKKIQDGNLIGTVTDPEGKPLKDFILTASQNRDNRPWSYSTTTDSSGQYNLTLLEGDAKIEGANSDYVVANQTTTVPSGSSKVFDLSAIFLPFYNITTEVYTKYIGSTWQGPLRGSIAFGINAKAIDAFGNGYYSSLVEKGKLSIENIRGLPGSKVLVCVEGRAVDLPEECQTIRLDNNRNITATFHLAQHGRIEGSIVNASSGEVVHGWIGELYSLNDSNYRTFVREYSNDSEIVNIPVSKAGIYQLDIKRPGQNQFGQLTTTVPDGDIVDVGKIKVYDQELMSNSEDKNGISATPSETSAGSTVTFRVQYNKTALEDVHNATLLLEVPENTAPVTRSITLNNIPAVAESVGSYYALPLGNLQGNSYSGVATYRLRLDPDFNASGLSVSALITYSKVSENQEQEQKEILGTTFVSVPGVSILGPSNLASQNTTLSGQAPVGSTVEVYDGNINIGEALASNGGLWSLVTTLPDTKKGNQSLHTVHAIVKTNASTLYSDDLNITYDPSKPQLIKICMDQVRGERVCFEPSQGVARFPYVLQPNSPLTFELSFNKPEDVSDVTVIVGGPGGGRGNASLGNDGIHRAIVKPDLSKSLGGIYIGYDTSTPLIKQLANLHPSSNISELLGSIPSELSNQSMKQLLGSIPSELSNQSMKQLLGSIPSELVNGPLSKSEKDMQAVLEPNIHKLKRNEPIIQASYRTNIIPISLSTFNEPGIISLQYNPNSAPLYRHISSNTVNRPVLECHNEIDKSGVITVCSTPTKPKNGNMCWDVIDSLGREDTRCGNEYPGNIPDISEIADRSCKTSLKDQLRIAEDLEKKRDDYLITIIVLAGAALILVSLPAGTGAAIFYGNLLAYLGAGFWSFSYYKDLLRGRERANQDLVGCPPWLKDPSGHVFEAISDNRLEKVNTTLVFKNPDSNSWSAWNADEYGQVNPQSTDPDGTYGWDVPEGDWQVIYEKPGYNRANSEVIHVSPPRTDVNIGMISMEPSKVTAISAVVNNSIANATAVDDSKFGTITNPSSINVQFSKYIPASNLTNATITVIHNPDANINSTIGQERLSGNVISVNATANSNGTLLTRQASFIPLQPLIVDNKYAVHVSDEIQSYAGIPMVEDYNTTVTAVNTLNYSLILKPNNNSSNKPSSVINNVSEKPIVLLSLGESLNATSLTTDALATNTTFVWIGPDGSELGMETVGALLSNGTATSEPFTPTQTGNWSIDAIFTDGNNVFNTRSASFNVTEAPVTPTVATKVGEGIINETTTVSTNVAESAPPVPIEEEQITEEQPSQEIIFPPLADAGSDQIVMEGTTGVSLNGSSSTDEDGNITSYSWKQTAGPSIKTEENGSTNNTKSIVFNVPFVASDTILTFDLIVTDNDNIQSSDKVNIIVKDKANNIPVANDQNVSAVSGIPKSIVLTGKDKDNTDKLTYSIGTLPAHGRIDAFNPIIGNVTYTSDDGYVGSDQFEFAVRDGKADSKNNATVSVTVSDAPNSNLSIAATPTAPTPSITTIRTDNTSDSSVPLSKESSPPPEVQASDDILAYDNSTVQLGGYVSNSHLEHTYSFSWNQTSGFPVSLDNSTSRYPKFLVPSMTGPDSESVLSFLLEVKDETGATGNDTMNVTIKHVDRTEPELDLNHSATISNVTSENVTNSEPPQTGSLRITDRSIPGMLN